MGSHAPLRVTRLDVDSLRRERRYDKRYDDGSLPCLLCKRVVGLWRAVRDVSTSTCMNIAM